VLGDDYQKERIELIVLEGNPIIQIVKAAYRIGAHRIVMGRREKYDMLDKVMGTVSLGHLFYRRRFKRFVISPITTTLFV
jgi:nucleotide-binding universal stress UspA family protein